MKDNPLLKWLLIGGAAYFVYDWYTKQQQPTVTPPPGGAPPPGGGGGKPPVTTAPPPAGPPAAQTTPQRIQAAAVAAGLPALATADEWCFFTRQVTGVPCPAPENFGFTGEQRSQKVTFDVFWQRLSAQNVPGISGLGWGANMSYANPWLT